MTRAAFLEYLHHFVFGFFVTLILVAEIKALAWVLETMLS